MQNGIVFSWGDGEEGKLGLGKPQSYVKPTMLDFLLPSSYAETAKRSANKDALLKTGAKAQSPAISPHRPLHSPRAAPELRLSSA